MLDFETFTASDPRPCLLVDRGGLIIAANSAARKSIPAARPGVELASLCAAGEAFQNYLIQCAGTRGPLRGALLLNTAEGVAVKWNCDGGFVGPLASDGPGFVVLRLVAGTVANASFSEQSKKMQELNAALLRSEHLQRAAAHLAAIVDSSLDAIVSKTLTGTVVSWNSGAQRIFGYTAQEMIGQSITRLLPSDRLLEEERILAEIKAGRIIEHYETIRVTKDGRNVDVSVTISPVRGPSGDVVGASKVARDITEQKRRERLVESLMREVNHRSKNMLGLVLAIARQSANGSPEHFLPRFSDRIHALAASQDLLVKNNWHGTSLDALVRAQLAHFDDLLETRIRLRGQPAFVNTAAAQSIGMALHELATNAVKYGALSNDVGTVEIDWGRKCGGSGDEFWMIWRESGGPPVVEPTRSGFGTSVISTLVRSNLSGRVDVEYAAKGFSWFLKCPATNALDDVTRRSET